MCARQDRHSNIFICFICFLVCRVVFAGDCGGRHLNMSECSLTVGVSVFLNRYMCIVLDRSVDSTLTDMHGASNIVKKAR